MTISIHDFPFHKLPKLNDLPLPTMQAAVAEATELCKTPPKLATYCALAVCGGLIQTLVDVEKPAGGVVGTNLYILQEGRSGERKTALDKLFTRSLRNVQKQLKARHDAEMKMYSGKLRA